MEQPQGKAVLTRADVSLQCTRVGQLVKAGWLGLQQSGSAFWCFRREAEGRSSQNKLLFRREKRLNPPCLYGRRVVASTELSMAMLGQAKAPSRHQTSSSSSCSIYLMRFKGHTQSRPCSGTNSQFLAVPELEASQDKSLHSNSLVWQPAVSCGGFSDSLLSPAGVLFPQPRMTVSVDQ